MGKSIQVSGSIAFDTILQFEGNFKENLVYESDKALSLSFFCPGMKKEFGGCAANIAYNLRLLDQECILLGSVGSDGKEYLRKINESGVNTDFCEI
ncbi:MAG: carbohydrate kinase family protein, partial [Proteobacteria bacterium]|nr:carbohydrate kinase family protein [Pseudomonadota bacterium]